MKIQHLFVATIMVLVSGCAVNLPPLNFSVPNVGLSQHKIDAELKSMTVAVARNDEKTGALDFKYANFGDHKSSESLNTQMVLQQWQTALQESINNMAIFQDDATKKVNLSVKILKLDITSLFGPIKVTATEARYEIIDRKSGDLIFTQNITSTGEVNSMVTMNGPASVKESINKSVQNNIQQFLQALETVDFKKPMFPAKVGERK